MQPDAGVGILGRIEVAADQARERLVDRRRQRLVAPDDRAHLLALAVKRNQIREVAERRGDVVDELGVEGDGHRAAALAAELAQPVQLEIVDDQHVVRRRSR